MGLEYEPASEPLHISVKYMSCLGKTQDHLWDLSGGGTTRAEDAQGIPSQSNISPSILVYEDHGLIVYHHVYNVYQDYPVLSRTSLCLALR